MGAAFPPSFCRLQIKLLHLCILVQFLRCAMSFCVDSLSGINARSMAAGLYVKYMFSSLRLYQTISQSNYHLVPTVYKRLGFSTPLPASGITTVFYFSCSNSVEWQLVVVFTCIPLMAGDGEHFSCVCHWYVLFGKMFLHVFCPFSNWTSSLPLPSFLLLSFENSLYILDMSALSDMGLANIFSVCSFSFHPLKRLFVGAQAFHFG